MHNKNLMLIPLVLIDQALLPVFHIFGFPFKISYIIGALWLFNYFVLQRYYIIINSYIPKKSIARQFINYILILCLLGALGELIILLYTKNINSKPFFEGITLYVLMIIGIGLGYCGYAYNKNIVLYILYIFVGLNIALVIFGDSIPIISKLYGEYYSSGVRIRGTGGNPNATLLIMNILLLMAISLVSKEKIRLNKVHMVLIIMIPLLGNIFLNSRGEMIHTILLLLYYILTVLRREGSIVKSLSTVILIILAIFLIYSTMFDFLYTNFEAVRHSVDRLRLMESVTDTENVKQTSTILRPLIHYDEFKDRFLRSPIIGSGFSYGAKYPFIRSAANYHNDWFRILVSSGVIGFIIWIRFVKKSIIIGGIYMIFPFITTALSNTFVQSEKVMILYFLLIGSLIRYYEDSLHLCKKNS